MYGMDICRYDLVGIMKVSKFQVNHIKAKTLFLLYVCI